MNCSWAKMLTDVVAMDVYVFCGLPIRWFELGGSIDGRMYDCHPGISFRLALIFVKVEIDIYDIRHKDDSDEPCQG